jgi:hypothetical protein
MTMPRRPFGAGMVSALGVAILAGIWSLVSLGGAGSFVPPPWTTLADSASLLVQPSSWLQIAITLLRVCIGFAGGFLVGATAGIAMGACSALDTLFKPLVLFFQGIPPLVWAIPLVVVLGIGHQPAILVITLITLPVVSVRVLRLSEDGVELKDIFIVRKTSSRISLDDVGFLYRGGQKLLQRVRLSVSPREIAVITGDSGVGKTTLLKLIGSLLKPTEGLVGCPQGIGFVFQDDRLLPWRNVSASAVLPLIYQGFSGLHREARRMLWDKLLRLLALHPVPVVVVTHFPEEISSTKACRLYELRGGPATLARIAL